MIRRLFGWLLDLPKNYREHSAQKKIYNGKKMYIMGNYFGAHNVFSEIAEAYSAVDINSVGVFLSGHHDRTCLLYYELASNLGYNQAEGNLGYEYYFLGEYSKALEHLSKFFKLCDAMPEDTQVAFMEVMCNCANNISEFDLVFDIIKDGRFIKYLYIFESRVNKVGDRLVLEKYGNIRYFMKYIGICNKVEGECPVCMDICPLIVMSCHNKHTVCDKCLLSIKKCPACDDSIF